MRPSSAKASAKAAGARLDRHCLVTIGATANFTALLEEATKLSFLEFLRDWGYTHVDLQCGQQLEHFQRVLRDIKVDRLAILPFAFVDDLRQEKMSLCRAEEGKRRDGVVISHAGELVVAGAELV